MTTIATYTDLQNAVTEYLARDQDATLIARIPTFIQLSEAKFNRMLFCRQMEQRSTTLTSTSIELTATAATATSSNVLQFGSVPSTVTPGMNVYDVTAGNLLIGSVNSVSSPTITLTANATYAVSSGDNIIFGSLEPQYIALPSDFQSMRRVRLTSTSPTVRLDYKSPAQMDEYLTSIADTPNQPQFFTIFGNELQLCPTPDTIYTVEMVYRQNIPALALNATNWLLTLAPDLYLYGALLESAPYIKEDGRIQTWALGFTTALNDVNGLGQMSTFNAGPLEMRISGVTP